MTVSELIIQLKQMVDESTTGSYPTDAECIDWLNEAQNIVAEELECLTEIVSSDVDVSEATTIAVPSDFMRCQGLVWDADGTHNYLTNVELQDLTEKSYDLTATGVPSYFYIYDGYIRFYPVPSADTDYVLYYIKAPMDLSTAASTPEIAARLHRLLAVYGAYRFWMKEEEPDMAAGFYGEFREGVDRARVRQKRRHKRNRVSYLFTSFTSKDDEKGQEPG